MFVSSLAHVKTNLSAVVDDVVRTHQQVTVTRNGEPAVVIMAVDDFESMEETLNLAIDPEARYRLHMADREMKSGEFVTRDEMAALMAAREQREGRG